MKLMLWFFDTISMPMAQVSRSGTIVRANGPLTQLLEYSEEELKRLHFADITHPGDLNADMTMFAELIDPSNTRTSYSLRKRWYNKSRHIVYGMLDVWSFDKNDPEGLLLAMLHDETKLQVDNHALHALRNSVLDGVWDWDVKAHTEHYSARFWEVLGYDPETKRDDCRPEAWQELIHPEDLVTAQELATKHVQSHGAVSYTLEARYTHASGHHTVYVICQGRVVEWDRDGQPLRWIGTHTDITSLKRKEQLIAEDLKNHTQFFHRQSHELRNAMHRTVSAFDQIKQYCHQHPQPDLEDVVELGYESTAALLHIVNDTLDLGKLQAGKMRLHPERVSPPSVVRRLAKAYAHRAQEHSHTIVTSVVHPDSPGTVIVDPVRLKQIMDNFMHNAMKFTRNGRIEIGVRPHHSSSRVVQFFVKDTGHGMSMEQQQLLFSEYTQLKRPASKALSACSSDDDELTGDLPHALPLALTKKHTLGARVLHLAGAEGKADTAPPVPSRKMKQEISRLQEGTGLGLSICQHLSVLMGATVELISSNGLCLLETHDHTCPHGSEFALSLPIGAVVPQEEKIREIKAQTSDMPDSATPGAGSIITGDTDTSAVDSMVVMVVDDCATNRKLARWQLKFLSRAPIICESGAECLALYQSTKEPVDVIFMDCSMPDMDGYETTRRLKKLPCYTGTRIIALTGDIAVREQAESAGMDGYLLKPVKQTKLIAALSEHRLPRRPRVP